MTKSDDDAPQPPANWPQAQASDGPQNDDVPGSNATETPSPRSATAAPNKKERTELDSLQQLLKQFHELREYFSYYVAAKADGVKLALRNTTHGLVLASLGFVAICGLIVTANWIVLSGTAEGLGLLCGGRAWAGKIIAGVLLLAVVGLWMCIAAARRRIASRERTVEKYEKRQAEQQAEFGRNVLDQAAAAASESK